MLFRLLILIIQLKKLNITQKLVKLKRKYQIIFIEIYITTQEFNKFTKDSFAARVKQASLASGSNIADFIKKTDFDGGGGGLGGESKICFK